MSRSDLAALTLMATTLAASGCGGSSASQRLTRGELIAKADAICNRAKAKRASVKITTQQKITKQQETGRAMSQVAAYEHAAAAELAKLTPPTSMAGDWNQIVAATQTLAADIVRVSEYAKANRLKAASGLIFPAIGEAERQIVTTARRNGFKDCARIA